MISAFHWKLFLKSLNVWHYHFPLKYLFGNSPLSFVSGSILFEFAILPDVYISGALFLLREHMHSTNLAAHLSKSLNPLCLQLYLQLVCLGKNARKLLRHWCSQWKLLTKVLMNRDNTNMEFNCVLVLIITPSNTSHWGILINVSKQQFLKFKFLKFLAIAFGWDC